MVVNRVEIVDENFRAFLQNWKDVPKKTFDLTHLNLKKEDVWELFQSQLLSRQIDFEARTLKQEEKSFYTIASSGHEGNAVLGRLLRPTDPALLHYRSGAFMAERYRYGHREDFVYSTMLSLCASLEDPTSGGRHKVWGSRELWVPPQTSTISSHLPKAVGMAMSLPRAEKMGMKLEIPLDSIVMASFGDASINHAAALTAFNSATWASYQHLPMPILFVCEDNGLGISVRTPAGWVKSMMGNRKGLEYFEADGLELLDTYEMAQKAMEFVRRKRRPAFLHIRTVRLLGHAGSDVETEYRTKEEIEAYEAMDPLIHSAQLILQNHWSSTKRILEEYDRCAAKVAEAGERASTRPKLTKLEDVIAPLPSNREGNAMTEAKRKPPRAERDRVFGDKSRYPENHEKPRHLAMNLNRALTDVLSTYPEAILFGEDVAKKGGVYHVTNKLSECFGLSRVFNTLLDETSILGMAVGFSHLGFLPIPEIQYLAYYHNAEDQIRSEAASMSFFSRGQFQNPMVIRIASFGYQKGFGGHFHNDNAIAALLEIPGVVVMAPSRGDDAVTMFRTAMALAKTQGRIVFFLEPIALYMEKDLHEPGDGLWSFNYPVPGEASEVSRARVYGEEKEDLLIISYANGLHRSLQAARILESEGIQTKVLDLRTLKPLPLEDLRQNLPKNGKVLIVDECREGTGVADRVFRSLHEMSGSGLKIGVVEGVETYVPLGPAAGLVMPSVQQIVDMAQKIR